MVELHWNGKQNPLTNPAHLSANTFRIQEWYPSDSQERGEMPPDFDGWYNRLILADRLPALSQLYLDCAGSIDLIYIDPPFMTGRLFEQGNQILYRDQWLSRDTYIQWLYETFMVLHALLAETGSLFVHLDWRATSYAKLLLDEVFLQGSSEQEGEKSEKGAKGQKRGMQGAGFQNEIIWHYQSGGRSSRRYARKHDTILWYTRSNHYTFHPQRIGERRGTQQRNHMRKEVASDGRISWTIRSAGRLYTYDEESLLIPSDVWSDLPHLHQKDPERTGYATQKPASLLERILLASSEENDLVLDCFCGSGVTPVVAERLGRRWLACDTSNLAIETTRARLLAQQRKHPFAFITTESSKADLSEVSEPR